jgi:hypothetical protein
LLVGCWFIEHGQALRFVVVCPLTLLSLSIILT